MTDVILNFNNINFGSWETMTIDRQIDAVDKFSFTAPFMWQDQQFQDNFKPFQYQNVNILADGSRLFTGTAVTILPDDGVDAVTISVDGYAKAGVIGDCQVPPINYPIEFQGLTLRQMAQQLAGYFGLTAVFANSDGYAFDQVALKTNQNIFDFLTSLAKERGLVISSNEDGNLLFQKTSSDYVGDITTAVTSAKPQQLNGQGIFSDYTAMGATVPGLGADSFTVVDNRIGVVRPFVFNTDGAADADTAGDAQAKAGRAYGEAISYTANIPSWRGPNGEIWKANTLCDYQNPKIFINRKTRFLIKSVSLDKTPNSETAVLTLVLPDSFEGKIPTVLPWE